jgi:hypothetical protein
MIKMIGYAASLVSGFRKLAAASGVSLAILTMWRMMRAYCTRKTVGHSITMIHAV